MLLTIPNSPVVERMNIRQTRRITSAQHAVDGFSMKTNHSHASPMKHEAYLDEG